MVVLGVVERSGRRDLGGDRTVACWPALAKDLSAGLGQLPLLVIGPVDRRAVLRPIVALAHGRLGRLIHDSPSYGDNPTDAGGGSGDITAIRITSGNGNLYVRWDETLTTNQNQIASDGFSITVDADRTERRTPEAGSRSTPPGNATVQVERPFGTFITVGSAQQSCNFSPCSNGGAASIEASFPLSAFNATGAIIGLQTETRASASTNSSVKDCVPGGGRLQRYFNLDTDTGTTTVTAGHGPRRR